MNLQIPKLWCGKQVFLAIMLIPPAAGISQHVSEKILTKYTQANNLSSYNIRKIAQDKQGFIWIATQDGLNRFDGNQFEIFRKNATGNKALLGVDIRDIIVDSVRNLVWVLSGQGGLDAISSITGTVVRSIPMRGDNEDWNISMTMTGGRIWIGSFKGVKVYDIAGNSLQQLSGVTGFAKDINKPFEARHVFADQRGNIWACISDYGITIIDGKEKKVINTIPGATLTGSRQEIFFRCSGSTRLKDGSVLLATTQGLRQVEFDSNYNYRVVTTPCKSFERVNRNIAFSVNRNAAGEVLVTTSQNVVLFDDKLDKYTILKQIRATGETDWFKTAFCTLPDNGNNIWLGCSEGLGFIKYRPDLFTPISYDDVSHRKLEHVHSLYPLRDGTILAGLKNGLMLVQGKKLNFQRLDSMHLYHHIYEDPNKRIHAVHTGGMLIYQDGKLLPVSAVYPELSAVSRDPVNSHLLLGDSIVILGTENDRGIIVWNLRKKSIQTIDATTKPLRLAANIVNALFKDSRGNIWVLSDKAITLIDEHFQQARTLQYSDSITKQPLNIFFDMCETGGYYWISAYGTGIIQLDSTYQVKKIFTAKDGLSNDGVYKIFCANENKLCITSNNGISIFDVVNNSFTNFFEKDGLHNDAFEEASGIMKDGIIYAGGVNGFTIIDLSNFARNSIPPTLYVNHLLIETNSGPRDTSNLFLKKIAIPNNVLQTNIQFSALNYNNPSRTTFYYKINELHKDWIFNGTRNFVNLIGLSPGTYTLQVKAANEDGVFSEPIELTLVFLPKWYQTWWLKLSIILALAAIAYSFYRMRIIQLKKEELIRRKIAGDLHDDLGSTLNSIKVYTNLALMKPENTSYLHQTKEGVQSAITAVRDLVWVLDDKQDTIRHLVERAEQFIGPLTSANEIRFEKVIEPSVQELSLAKEEKRNLYLIIKEAVNNSIKYASPTIITLQIGLNQRNKFFVKISDNGKGFDPATVKRGNGLENLTLRAGQIRYELHIQAETGKGAGITLTKA